MKRYLGRLQRDLLHSLDKVEEASLPTLKEDTGCVYRHGHHALHLLLDAGLVGRRQGSPIQGRRWSWMWFITPEGRAELQLRERAGYAPGVPRIGDPTSKDALERVRRLDAAEARGWYRKGQRRWRRKGPRPGRRKAG